MCWPSTKRARFLTKCISSSTDRRRSRWSLVGQRTFGSARRAGRVKSDQAHNHLRSCAVLAYMLVGSAGFCSPRLRPLRTGPTNAWRDLSSAATASQLPSRVITLMASWGGIRSRFSFACRTGGRLFAPRTPGMPLCGRSPEGLRFISIPRQLAACRRACGGVRRVHVEGDYRGPERPFRCGSFHGLLAALLDL